MTALRRRSPYGGDRASGIPDGSGTRVPPARPGPGRLLLAGGLALLVAGCQVLFPSPPPEAEAKLDRQLRVFGAAARAFEEAECEDLELGYRAPIHEDLVSSGRAAREFTGALRVAPVRDADRPAAVLEWHYGGPRLARSATITMQECALGEYALPD